MVEQTDDQHKDFHDEDDDVFEGDCVEDADDVPEEEGALVNCVVMCTKIIGITMKKNIYKFLQCR